MLRGGTLSCTALGWAESPAAVGLCRTHRAVRGGRASWEPHSLLHTKLAWEVVSIPLNGQMSGLSGKQGLCVFVLHTLGK